MSQSTATELLLPFIKFDEESEKKEALSRIEALLAKSKAEQLKKFTKGNLFGEKGIFRELPKDQQKELLTAVLTLLEEETQKDIHRIGQGEFGPDGIDWDQANLEPRLKHLLEAAENDVFLLEKKKLPPLIMQLSTTTQASVIELSGGNGKKSKRPRLRLSSFSVKFQKALLEMDLNSYRPASAKDGKSISTANMSQPQSMRNSVIHQQMAKSWRG